MKKYIAGFIGFLLLASKIVNADNIVYPKNVNVDSLNGMMTFTSGEAVSAVDYQMGRDADATNQLHFNVPTGASYEWSQNDALIMQLTAAANVSTLHLGTTGIFGQKIIFDSNGVQFSDSGVSFNSSSHFLKVGYITGITTGANTIDFKNFSANMSFATFQNETGNVTWDQIVQTSGSPTHVKWTPAAHTTLANADLTDEFFNLTRNVEFIGAAGATTINNTYGIRITPPAYKTNGAGATTITNGSTVYISGAPTTAAGGGGTTITNAYALNVAAGATNLSGNITTAGTFISSNTSTLGWSVQAAANQACTTTCTTACVFGFDTALGGTDLVDCSDATADRCVCAGAS